MPVGFTATGILFGITLNWGYPEGAEDALKTEIEYSLSADGTDAMLLVMCRIRNGTTLCRVESRAGVLVPCSDS